MPINSPEDAIATVAANIPQAASLKLIASRIGGYDRYWYVSAQDDDGNALVGGSAFVVAEGSGDIHEVPASRPPRLNLQSVAAEE